MASATLKMHKGSNCWNQLTLVVNNDNVSRVINLINSDIALDIYRELSIKHFDNDSDDTTIAVDGTMYDFTHDEWCAILDTLDQWFEEFITCSGF